MAFSLLTITDLENHYPLPVLLLLRLSLLQKEVHVRLAIDIAHLHVELLLRNLEVLGPHVLNE